MAALLQALGDSSLLVVAEVAVKVLKDTNIGWGHGTGHEAPGAAVAGYPAVIFYDRVESTSDCQVACVADPRCTGFVWTDDDDTQEPVYHTTCYFRTDGCHTKSCDPKIQAQAHHDSGYLYCETDESATTQAQLDACGHEDGQGSGGSFVLVLAVLGGMYVGLGVAVGKRSGRSVDAGRGGLLHAHPHYPRWQALAGLVSDGVAFTRGRASGKARQAGYEAVPKSTSASSAKKQKRESRTGDGSKKEKSGARKDSKRSGNHNKSSKTSSGGQQSEAAHLVSSKEAAPAAAQQEAAGTAAGGGGRWVHVPT
eukprot:COSAG02_NODE_5311_length_4447_cov_38.707452_3_plen_310_part_00